VPEVLAAVRRQLEGKAAPLRLPLLDVAYSGPHGGALGVIVRSSVDTAAEGASDTLPAPTVDDAPGSEVVEVGRDSRAIPR
jgi:hypothetical protein